MKKQVLDQKGNKVEEISLNDGVFCSNPNREVLTQYIRVFDFNQRSGTAKTKTRAEVAGGGAKPWRQKGTGRARAGSIRSPLWVHGGVAHGPLPKDWSLKMPKKMRRLAMISALSLKEAAGEIVVVDSLKLEKMSTSELSTVLNKLVDARPLLYVWSKADQSVIRSIANIKDVKPVFSGSLNAKDLISHKAILFEKDAILDVNERFKK
ncbi:MAG: 50S ribosomal protein L4 [Patescibacteria group bacterium]|nr:MAG: 50S ribosomal protein L4 [Patescibacteria group bacterium]